MDAAGSWSIPGTRSSICGAVRIPRPPTSTARYANSSVWEGASRSLAHPTKEGGKAPSVADASLYDINGGAVWNNKADLGVIVWADDVTKPDRFVKVAKSKDFIRYGIPGIVQVRFDAERSTFNVIK
jgi:hypothetical protein